NAGCQRTKSAPNITEQRADTAQSSRPATSAAGERLQNGKRIELLSVRYLRAVCRAAQPSNRRRDIGKLRERVERNAAPLRLDGERLVGAVVLRVESGVRDTEPRQPVGERRLVKAGELIGRLVAGTEELIGRVDLVLPLAVVDVRIDRRDAF